MKIPIRILVTDLAGELVDDTWGDVIDNWQAYAQEWQAANSLQVVQDEAPVLDMYGDESITIKKVVKDLDDPKKLLTGLSKSFTIPASKKNNKILKHYYNIDIVNGLDTRELLPCKILLNNVTYQTGNLNVEGVNMRRGKAVSYRVRFVGKLSELSKRIGQDYLSGLDLSDLNIDNFSTKTAFNSSVVDDIVFPVASRSSRYLFNNSVSDIAIEGTKNIAFVNTTLADNYGIDETELIGALKVGKILDKIETAYGLNFTGVFEQEYIRDLYLWLHKTDKQRDGEAALLQKEASGINYLSGTYGTSTSLVFNDSSIVYDGSLPSTNRYRISVTPTFVGTTSTIHVVVDGQRVSSSSVSGQETFPLIYLGVNSAIVTFEAEGSTSATIALDISVALESETPFSYAGSYFLTVSTAHYGATAALGGAGYYKVSNQMPKMKVIDFLSSLFKMYNIVSEVDDSLNVHTSHFDAFMSRGVVRDITEYISTDNYTVDKPNLHAAMKFEFAEPKVAMEQGYLAVNGKQYGELSYDLTSSNGYKFSGSEYVMRLNNQRIPLEPLSNLANGTLTQVIYTQFADLKAAEQQTSPMFTYVSSRAAATALAWNDGATVSQVTSYIQASNVFVPNSVASYTVTPTLGLYFGEELNEYNTTNSTTGLGLYNSFYKGITALMFNEDKRSVKMKAELPIGIIKTMSLADTLKISNNNYVINSIETNYLTGMSNLNLTLVGRSRLFQFYKQTTNITTTNSTQASYINWSGNLTTITVSAGVTVDILSVGDIISYDALGVTINSIS